MTIAENWVAQGKAETLLEVLEARGLRVTSEQRARILACTDPTQLSRWAKTVVTATSADALFAP
ncbi:hypothetical protein [Pendulispora albinea]|uniref:Uncharacterized protein n=1 Tax=Pendulispora albinea TaxID=2741071 RepID=A0ABZ2LUD7_9BACT